ncbi:MAG TPA: hypothetical protein IGS17_17360 [Oscillatoriales cyanobacterium M59_W2019_021]|nr:MAG: hypothetical protein D6728_08030 [Cyanobacteria bacterium J055]HIK33672.1 hypothetical protein [Oscillatoriales cyanobacterium M4454_W2019_049]HIK52674.1 hypothetical protein [Oscillatoriales cyanobacterium M59_W2019_021]
MFSTILLISFILIGWVAAALLGTQAYFRGEQTKPIHERNWNSETFDRLAQSFTGNETDYGDRTPAYALDAYTSNNISR